MVEDDDFYLRIKMSGAKYCQLFETAVYHMPSKSVRMREDGQNGEDNPEFHKQYNKSIRNREIECNSIFNKRIKNNNNNKCHYIIVWISNTIIKIYFAIFIF